LGNLSLRFYDLFSIWSKSFLFFFCSLRFSRFILSVYQIFPQEDIGSYPLRPRGGGWVDISNNTPWLLPYLKIKFLKIKLFTYLWSPFFLLGLGEKKL
jgi:hypothetical protein